MESPPILWPVSSPGVCLPPSLEQAKVRSLPSSAFYIPDFISEDEERVFLDKIASAPKPRWKQLTHRRLQTWPSDLVKNALIDAPLPQWLEEPVISRLLSMPITAEEGHANIFTASPHQRPNHVLVNEYPPGVGIMPHKVCYVKRQGKVHVGKLMGFAGWCSVSPRSMYGEPGRKPVSEPVQNQRGRHSGPRPSLANPARATKPPHHDRKPLYRLPPRNSRHREGRAPLPGNHRELGPPSQ